MTTGATIVPNVWWCDGGSWVLHMHLHANHSTHTQAGPVTQQDMEQLVMRLYEIEVIQTL